MQASHLHSSENQSTTPVRNPPNLLRKRPLQNMTNRTCILPTARQEPVSKRFHGAPKEPLRVSAGTVGPAAAVLTDNQLDSLLGDIDIDAAIAESGRVGSVEIKEFKASGAQSKSSPERKNTPSGNSESAHASYAREGKSLKHVDEGMICSLFEGVDTSDFS